MVDEVAYLTGNKENEDGITLDWSATDCMRIISFDSLGTL